MHARTRSILTFLTIFLLFLYCHAECEETGFEIKRLGNINPYGNNEFWIHTAEDGLLTIQVHDSICVYRTITEEIQAGETTLSWDGCGYNREKLYEKYYTITAVFTGKSGSVYTVSFDSPIDYPLQFLQYALPSSEILYLDEPENWFLEYRTVTKGTILMELTAINEPDKAFVFSIPAEGGKISRRDFKTIAGRKDVTAGIYTITIYEINNPDNRYEYSLSILNKSPEPERVTMTGEIMPDRSMSDEEIWHLMMRPSVVIDIDPFKHQNIYKNPDDKSSSLGTLHGQTQGVKVIRTEDNWAMIGAWNHEDASYVEGWVPLDKLKTVSPRPEYGILIDKQNQTLKVYRYGHVIDTLLVSTGRMDKNRLYQETSAGCFLTGYHRVNFSMNGKKYDYVIQYDGGNLLHQTPYDWGQYKKDFTYGRGYLGAKASHACVRIQPEPGEGGLNAYWLFTHIPYHTRVVILDDPDERTAAMNRVGKDENIQPASGLARIKENTEPATDQSVVMTFGGCLTPGGTRSFNSRKESFLSFTEKNGYDIPLSSLSKIFEKDDLTCVSLGCTIQAGQSGTREEKDRFSAPKGIESIFRNASVELIQATDDRIFNRDSESCKNTIDALSSFSETLVNGHTIIIPLKGSLFGFAGCSQHEYLLDPQIIDRRIAELKNKGCEHIIMLASWGDDRSSTHSIVQEAMARRCVSAGASLVIGNQPGAVQGIDFIQGVPVVYSLGDLLNGSTSARPKKQQGMLIQAEFFLDSKTREPSLTVIPVLPYGTDNEKNNYCPVAAPDPVAAEKLIQTVWRDTPDQFMEKIVFYYP